jgi:hypothetical protein
MRVGNSPGSGRESIEPVPVCELASSFFSDHPLEDLLVQRHLVSLVMPQHRVLIQAVFERWEIDVKAGSSIFRFGRSLPECTQH